MMTESQYHIGSLMSIKEDAPITYPQTFDELQQQMRVDFQQTPFQFSKFTPSNALPINNHMSLLSQHLKDQSYAQSYGNTTATSPVINQSIFNHSAGQAARSPIHHFMSHSLNTNGQDQYTGFTFEDDLDEQLQLLSPGPEITSPAPEFTYGPSQAPMQPLGTQPIVIPTKKFHGRGASFSNSVRAQHHPYRSPSYGGAETICSPGTSFVDDIVKYFAPRQQQAALNIMNYKAAHPGTAIPASFITSDLAEVQDGRGWCLIGNCGVDRANQRLNPHYDPSKDTARKRLDHLYDHIRDKHFNCRPFRCSMNPWYVSICAHTSRTKLILLSSMQTFSREHDLKRHEKTHTAVSLPCDICGKQYTREDNLKRHAQLKHFSLPQTSRGTSSTSSPY
jgi:hypothetical protein